MAQVTVTFRAQGHPNITASHTKTLELTRDTQVTKRATCVVGTAADYDCAALRRLRGELTVSLAIGGAETTFGAQCSPFFVDDDALVFRRGPTLRQRTFAGSASTVAAELDRAMVEALRQPGAQLEVTLRAADRGGRGVLWVVATPIGNPGDLSPRAAAVLGAADGVLAEDTRRYRQLAAGAGIGVGALESHHLANEAGAVDELIRRLRGGARLALVSDAGTPLVSDPGYPLLRAARHAGIDVVAVPGPSSMLAALVSSGFPPAPLWFEGYLPRTRAQRRRRLDELAAATAGATLVLLESPRRVIATLEDLDRSMSGREVCIARELTKIHEEILHGTARALLEQLGERSLLGEVTLVVAPPEHAAGGEHPAGADAADRGPHEVGARVARDLLAEGLPTAVIARAVQSATGCPRNAAYSLVLDVARETDPGSTDT